MFQLTMKLKNVKQELLAWGKGKDLFNSANSLKKAKESLLQIQNQLNLNPLSTDLVSQERDAREEYIEQSKRDEESMRLKARAIWLQGGDQNSKFFHSMHRSRTNSNLISEIKNSHGVWLGNQDEIGLHFTNHFKDAYNRNHRMYVDDYLHPRRMLNPKASAWLSRPFTDEEVLNSIKAINRDKSPGPDGFTAGFFQDNWNLIKSEVLKAIKNFFKHLKMLQEVNKTHICLIPKKASEAKVEDFRPISLCNTTYKIIIKCLADRLKIFLLELISINQSAFVSGSKIADNIILAQELLKGFMQKKSEKKICIQMDITKAFDSINRDFVLLILKRMGFDDRFIC